MNGYDSSGSEFDSDDNEAENLLYAQLYFGNPEENNYGISMDPETRKENNLVSTCSLGLPVVSSLLKETTKLVSPRYSCLSSNNLNGSSVPIFDSTATQSNNVLIDKVMTKPQQENVSGCIETAIIASSQSLDLIGQLNEEVVPYLHRSGEENAPLSPCYSSDGESRYSVLKDKDKSKKETSNQPVADIISSSEEEICVVQPPNSKNFVETYTIDSAGSATSDDDIYIIGSKKSTRNLQLQKTSIEYCVSDDSDDSDASFNICYNSSQMNNSLVMNLKKKQSVSLNRPTTRKIYKPSKFVKSQAIFTKSRPLTTRTPSCSKWSREMSSFYDSDISEDLDVDQIKATQSDSLDLWKIGREDLVIRSVKRYFNRQTRCTRCREFGHSISSCKRVPHCLYCGSSKHQYINKCPENCCLKCGIRPPHSYCHKTNPRDRCHLCQQCGHPQNQCPDLWRRFHVTTEGNIPIVPQEIITKPQRDAYCYNCGERGHFGVQCRDRSFKKYKAVSTLIFSYDTSSFSNNKWTPKRKAPLINSSPYGSTDVEMVEEVSIARKGTTKRDKYSPWRKTMKNNKLCHELDIPTYAVRLFGLDRCFIKEVEKETGANVSLSRRRSGSFVQINGKSGSNISKAQRLILGLLNPNKSSAEAQDFNERMKTVALASKMKKKLKHFNVLKDHIPTEKLSQDIDSNDELENVLNFIDTTLNRPKAQTDYISSTPKTKMSKRTSFSPYSRPNNDSSPRLSESMQKMANRSADLGSSFGNNSFLSDPNPNPFNNNNIHVKDVVDPSIRFSNKRVKAKKSINYSSKKHSKPSNSSKFGLKKNLNVTIFPKTDINLSTGKCKKSNLIKTSKRTVVKKKSTLNESNMNNSYVASEVDLPVKKKNVGNLKSKSPKNVKKSPKPTVSKKKKGLKNRSFSTADGGLQKQKKTTQSTGSKSPSNAKKSPKITVVKKNLKISSENKKNSSFSIADGGIEKPKKTTQCPVSKSLKNVKKSPKSTVVKKNVKNAPGLKKNSSCTTTYGSLQKQKKTTQRTVSKSSLNVNENFKSTIARKKKLKTEMVVRFR